MKKGKHWDREVGKGGEDTESEDLKVTVWLRAATT